MFHFNFFGAIFNCSFNNVPCFSSIVFRFYYVYLFNLFFYLFFYFSVKTYLSSETETVLLMWPVYAVASTSLGRVPSKYEPFAKTLIYNTGSGMRPRPASERLRLKKKPNYVWLGAVYGRTTFRTGIILTGNPGEPIRTPENWTWRVAWQPDVCRTLKWISETVCGRGARSWSP